KELTGFQKDIVVVDDDRLKDVNRFLHIGLCLEKPENTGLLLKRLIIFAKFPATFFQQKIYTFPLVFEERSICVQTYIGHGPTHRGQTKEQHNDFEQQGVFHVSMFSRLDAS